MSGAPEQFHWQVTAEAKPGDPGSARVTTVARNGLVPEFAVVLCRGWSSVSSSAPARAA